MKKIAVPLIFSLIICSFAFAQKSNIYSSAEIAQAMNKLQVLGNVLYIAAHPDDENTRLITYFENEKLYRTGYLSLTRGDGGQNLIGPEIREKLGVIRTQELLQARVLDGGEQFFSRANDFGYSKHPDETFEKWDREVVLEDMVWVIRTFKPDVIVTRFNTEAGTTHGHHTASAILAAEAFEAATDPNRYPEQLKRAAIWKTERLLWNTSSWFFQNRSDFDTTGLLKIDVGRYNPLLGKSYTEIAAESRSMHKSQGFGSALQRGTSVEYLQPVSGSTPSLDLFEGINTAWSRVKGGAEIEKLVAQTIKEFKAEKPSQSVPRLLSILKKIESMPDNPYKKGKLNEVKDLIKACLGLYLEVVAKESYAAPGDSLMLAVEVVNRSKADVRFQQLCLLNGNEKIDYRKKLKENERLLEQVLIRLPDTIGLSQPFWLAEAPDDGMFKHASDKFIGMAENPPALVAGFTMLVEGKAIDFHLPVMYKYTEPSDGEIYQPFSVVPPVAVNSRVNKLLFTGQEPQELTVEVVAGTDSVEGTLSVNLPVGWKAEPAAIPYNFLLKGESKFYRFTITAPEGSAEQWAEVVATHKGRTYHRGLEFIRYPHIPTQVYMPEAKVKLVKMQLSIGGDKIAYLMGAGDDMPENLRQIGYQVDVLAPSELQASRLNGYQAVVLGVRALNTLPELKFKKSVLEHYARQGGVVIIQYATSFGLIDENFAPFDLKLSRKRITVEDAPVSILKPEHRVFQSPNKISLLDFGGWVQERGLYFADSWGDEWTPLISSHDPGEEPLKGGLLLAGLGEGYFVYTGYSWFRQLPAGVPGAFRIFVNLLSLGKPIHKQ